MICAIKKVHIIETVSRRHRDTFCHRDTARVSIIRQQSVRTDVLQRRGSLSDCSSYVRRLAPQDVRDIRNLTELTRPRERASHPCRRDQKEVVVM